MSNDNSEERAAFETWAATRKELIKCERGQVNLIYLTLHKTYVDAEVHRAWEVWQARAALSSRPVPQWFDEPFVAECLQSMGLQAPTPREFGETIARRYAARIKELEAALSSAPAREPMTDEQIESLPVWKHFIGLFPSTRKEISRAIERHHGITKE